MAGTLPSKSRPRNYLVDESFLGGFYKTIFPLDLFIKPTALPADRVFKLQKRYELFPVLLFLIPFVVLLTGFSYSLSFWGTLFLYIIEAALLAIASQYYLKCRGGQTVELAIQYFCAFCIWSLLLLIVTWFTGCAANPDNWPED